MFFFFCCIMCRKEKQMSDALFNANFDDINSLLSYSRSITKDPPNLSDSSSEQAQSAVFSNIDIKKDQSQDRFSNVITSPGLERKLRK